MKLKRNKYILIFSLSLITFSAFAQNFKSDYQQVGEVYNKLTKFYSELKINVYEDQMSNVPSQKMVSVVKKNGNDYWYSMDKIKMVMNDACILYINEDNKQMIYTIRNKKNEMKIPNQNTVEVIDTILKKSDSVVFIGMDDKCKKYIIYSHTGMITKSEISINKDNFLISKIVYYYRVEKGEKTSMKVEINYVKMDLSPQFLENEFSEKQYASFNRNVLKPIGKYIGYETSVIDQNDIK